MFYQGIEIKQRQMKLFLIWNINYSNRMMKNAKNSDTTSDSIP